jgi:hypothetical protein
LLRIARQRQRFYRRQNLGRTTTRSFPTTHRMFSLCAKHRQGKFVKFFTISAELMNRIRRCVESTSVSATDDDVGLLDCWIAGLFGCWLVGLLPSREGFRGWVIPHSKFAVQGSMFDVRFWMFGEDQLRMELLGQMSEELGTHVNS